MFTIIAIGIVVLLVAIFGFAASRPNVFRMQRSMSMKARPEKIFALINDFHQWAIWSPWDKMDPTMNRSYSGSEKGKGAIYGWDGKGKVGAGRMEIVESTEASKLVIKLDFIRPFEGHNITEFTLETQGDVTTVTWSMHGPQPYMAKVMSLFFNMDKIVGKDFEAGLTNMKAAAET